MSKIIGIATAVIVFLVWHSLIGNLHVIETVIGLVLAAVSGIWVYSRVNKRFK